MKYEFVTNYYGDQINWERIGYAARIGKVKKYRSLLKFLMEEATWARM
jgi:hypothetical protein